MTDALSPCGSWRTKTRGDLIHSRPRVVCTRQRFHRDGIHYTADRAWWWRDIDMVACASDTTPIPLANPTTRANPNQHPTTHTRTGTHTMTSPATNRTVLSGSSDDTISLDGGIYEEFPYNTSDDRDHPGDLLAFSDGTVLRIRRDGDGIWRITPTRIGTGLAGIDQAPADDDDNRSDRAALDGVTWVVHGTGYASTR